MKRSIIVTAYLVLVLFMSSCGKYTCVNPGIHVTFSGFDSITLSKVLVEQYISNSHFSTLVGISVYDTGITEVRQSNDTVYMPPIDTSGVVIAPGYDYIVAVPGVVTSFYADSAFEITKISYDDVKRKISGSGTYGCTNDVSYALDSIPYKVAGSTYTKSNLPHVTIVLNK